MSERNQVEGYTNLLKDTHSKGIINTNKDAYLAAIARKKTFEMLITGDFITDTPTEPELQSLGKLLLRFSSKCPIYACLGNHDGGSWASKNGGPHTSEDLKRVLKKLHTAIWGSVAFF